jgi:hypothetical protein
MMDFEHNSKPFYDGKRLPFVAHCNADLRFVKQSGFVQDAT